VGHHRYIKVNMVVWVLDTSTAPATSGPPDAALAGDLATKVKNVKPRAKEKDHDVVKTEVTSTSSQTTPP